MNKQSRCKNIQRYDIFLIYANLKRKYMIFCENTRKICIFTVFFVPLQFNLGILCAKICEELIKYIEY